MKRAIRYIFYAMSAGILTCSLSGCGLMQENAVPAPEENIAPLFKSEPVRYDVDITVQNPPQDGSDSSIRSAMEKHSQLVLLKDQLPDGILGLTRRARTDKDNAVKLLHSLGYYEGKADFRVTEPASPDGRARVELILTPGTRYTFGTVRLSYDPQPTPLPEFPGTPAALPPKELDGIVAGSAALTDAVLSAVGKLPEKFQQSGYPDGQVTSTRYTLDRNARTLNADVVVDPGTAAVMGNAIISGNKNVDTEYIRDLIPWKKGEPWDSRQLMAYREELQRLGLFRRVDIRPAAIKDAAPVEGAAHVELPALVEVREAPFKTISASARYSTDIGIGVQGEWEHRNLFGAGEKLKIKAPFAQDKRGLQADFEKPGFGHRKQKLLAGISYLKEETDAFDTSAQNAYIGLERKLSDVWWAQVKLFGEIGTVTREKKEDYHYMSAIFQLRRDTRDSLLNPTRGTHLEWTAAPTTGYHNGDFTGTYGKISASAYYSPFDDDLLVLAARYSLGAFFGAELNNIPPSLRFYCGGGGSVRGYSYQAIGPRDRYGDPLGGRSFQEINLEARFRVAKDIGIVPFVDGGMIYEKELPELFQDFQWAAGLGLRYYTPIGPIRFDVAVPLDKKNSDSGYQIYISIGQAF